MPPRAVRVVARTCLALLALMSAACASAPTLDRFVGHAMDFEAERLDAAGTLRLADLRGKVVLVDVFASWCVPCRDAVPAWREMRAQIGTERIEVVGVSVDESRDMALSFVEEMSPEFPTVWDSAGDFVTRYPVESMPTLFLIDRDGFVRHVHTGFVPGTASEIEARVLGLLASAQ